MQKSIRDDPIQVDRVLAYASAQLRKLVDINKQLQQENQQLQNKPDIVYDPPPKKTLMITRGKEKFDLLIDIKKWKTGHFLKYFQELHFKKYGIYFKISGKQWAHFAIRIKQFRDTHEDIQNNIAYKNMVNWLFKHKFTRKFIASIPLISSDTTYQQWRIASNGKEQRKLLSPTEIAAKVPKPRIDMDKFLREGGFTI